MVQRAALAVVMAVLMDGQMGFAHAWCLPHKDSSTLQSSLRQIILVTGAGSLCMPVNNDQ